MAHQVQEDDKGAMGYEHEYHEPENEQASCGSDYTGISREDDSSVESGGYSSGGVSGDDQGSESGRSERILKRSKQKLKGYIEALESNNAYSLSMRDIYLDESDASEIADALEGNSSVHSVFLRNCQVESLDCWCYLGEALAQKLSLAHFTLEGERPKNRNICVGPCIAAILEGNSNIKSLSLQDCYISTSGCKLVGEALRVARMCEFLWFEGIDNIGPSMLSGLADNSFLTKMTLENCRVSQSGLSELGKALARNKALTHLSLNEIKIDVEAATAIGRGLYHNKTLEILHLVSCCIEEDAAVPMFKHLGGNTRTRISELRLENNCIGAAGVEAVIQMVVKNSSLKRVSLKDSNLCAEAGTTFIKSFTTSDSNSVVDLDYSGNSLMKQDFYKLRCYLARDNRSLRVFPLERIRILQQSTNEKRVKLSTTRIQDDVQHFLYRNELLCAGNRLLEEQGASAFVTIKHAGGLCDVVKLSWTAEAWRYIEIDGGAAPIIRQALQNITPDSIRMLLPRKKQATVDMALVSSGFKDILSDLVDDCVNEDGENMLHCAVQGTANEALQLCKYMVEVLGVDLERLQCQDFGQSARELALSNDSFREMREWAQPAGFVLGRYCFDRRSEGSLHNPKYTSKTYVVYFATDKSKKTNDSHHRVAVIIFFDQCCYERECSTRLQGQSVPESGVELSSENKFDEANVVPVLRVHYAPSDIEGLRKELRRSRRSAIDKGLWSGVVGCFIVPQVERTLDEIMRNEDTTGMDLNRVVHCAKEIANSLCALHSDADRPVFHGCLTPKKIVRWSGGYRLLDVGALSSTTSSWSERLFGIIESAAISGYMSPELARLINPPIENKENELHYDFDQQILALQRAMSSSKDRFVIEVLESKTNELKSRHKATTNARDSSSLLAAISPSLDIWSYGVIVYQMLAGAPLFFCKDVDDDLCRESDARRLISWSGLTNENKKSVLGRNSFYTKKEREDAISFLEKCLACDPADRFLSMQEVLAHKLFTHSTNIADRRTRSS
jgi:serine/threonine protein kinase